MDKDLKAKVAKWVEAVGIANAEAYLIKAKISSSAAQKITRGKYDSQPNALTLEAIQTAMKKGA